MRAEVFLPLASFEAMRENVQILTKFFLKKPLFKNVLVKRKEALIVKF